MAVLFLKKSIDKIIAETGGESGLQRTLGSFSVLMMGIGAIIGAGIFTLTGEVAFNHAGPGIVFCFIGAAILSAFAGVCYAEMAAMIPVAGSAYAYTYATMGEGIAWTVGWILTLEYALGAGVVANGWSGYVCSFLSQTMHINIPDSLLCFTKGPQNIITLSNGQQIHGIWNIPASLITLLLTCVLYRGMKKSATLNTVMVIIKMIIVAAFILLGFYVLPWSNLIVNPDASNIFARMVPIPETIVESGETITRYGWLKGGILSGIGSVFYAYIGFDSVTTIAQEVKNPKRDIAIGMLGSLIICTIIYILMGIVLTGVVHYQALGTSNPIALGTNNIATLLGWSTFAQTTLTGLINIGVIIGLTTVILVLLLGQTRVWYSMSKDGLLPWFSKLHTKHQSPHIATVITGIIAILASGLLPIKLLADTISLGVILTFLIVCVTVPIMRITNPKVERPFRIPMYWLICTLGIVSCSCVMWGFSGTTWSNLVQFLVLGNGMYFIYGRRHSLLQYENHSLFGPIWIDYVAFCIQLSGLVISNNILSLVAIMLGVVVSIKNVKK